MTDNHAKKTKRPMVTLTIIGHTRFMPLNVPGLLKSLCDSYEDIGVSVEVVLDQRAYTTAVKGTKNA